MDQPEEQQKTARFPSWIRRRWAPEAALASTAGVVAQHSLNTVCSSARCPNRAECWSKRTATFMILGGSCTRNCRYCAVDKGKPDPLDPLEPAQVAQAAAELELRHVVVTSVTRDDLADGGAAHFAATIKALRHALPHATIEVLTPDFQGDAAAVGMVCAAGPHVFGHNVEVAPGLYPGLRGPRAQYERSLEVLRDAAAHAMPVIVKSALMVGLGESPEDVRGVLRDLREAGCEAVAIGQYLQPSQQQRPVAEFVHPDRFEAYENDAYAMGFSYAVGGPFVRSSYRCEEALGSPEARERVAAINLAVATAAGAH